jgi:AcrR family transcriptional regulator
MKAEAVRRSSQDKIAHGGERRESKPRLDGGERRESKPAHQRDRRDSRWDEHRAQRRRQLVDAALAAVGKHGARVGMDEIAAEAGTSKTVVYRHFADRAELHVAVCNRVAAQLLPKLQTAIQSGDEPRQMVAAVGEQAAAVIAVGLQDAGRDPAAARPWGHGVVGLVRSAADWWLQADRPMLRTELAAHLTDLAWAGLSAIGTPQEEK